MNPNRGGGNMTPLITQFQCPYNNDSGNRTGVSESGWRSLPPISPNYLNPMTRYPTGSLHLNPEENRPMLQQLDFTSSVTPWSSSLPPKSPSPYSFRPNSLHPVNPSPKGSRKHSRSVSNSMDGSFLENHYSAYQLEKIARCPRLRALASDPKKVKLILANREAAARSNQRKEDKLRGLVDSVAKLEKEKSQRLITVAQMEENKTMLMNEKNELKIRVASIEQELQEKQALTEQLREEVQRLRQTWEMIQNSFQLDTSNMQLQDPNMFEQQVNMDQFNEHQTNPDMFWQI